MNAQPAMQSESARTSFFTDNGDGTVTDSRTGKLWTKAMFGGKPMTFEEAQKACAELNEQKLGGRIDWCIAEIEEIFQLADHRRYSPAIDTDAFPDTESDWYWSNTPTPWAPSCVFVVHFSNGYVNASNRNLKAFLRAYFAAKADVNEEYEMLSGGDAAILGGPPPVASDHIALMQWRMRVKARIQFMQADAMLAASEAQP